jgi:RNA-directed DNA polymerase
MVSIGYERKKKIRAALHHAEQGKLTTTQKAQLGGLLAFVQDVEPEFLRRLIVRYGTALISDIKAIRSRHE